MKPPPSASRNLAHPRVSTSGPLRYNYPVDDVTAAWDDETLHLAIVADEYPAVEMWQAERNAAALMEEAFERRLVLESTAAPEPWVNGN